MNKSLEKQISDIIYKVAPELTIKQHVQMRIEIIQVVKDYIVSGG